MKAHLTYAINKNNELVHVDSVLNGKACDCFCPHCHAPLVAKNGVPDGIRQHHFAHVSGQECEGAYESSVHLLAKEIIKEAHCIFLPDSSKQKFPSGRVVLTNVEAEKLDKQLGIKPDVEGYMTNGEKLLIEFNFTHKVDTVKRKIIVDNRLLCIEIDIKFQVLNKESLRNFLIDSNESRRWIVAETSNEHLNGENTFSSGRKEIFFKTRDILKQVFEENNIWIKPFHWRESFDIKALCYDTCEVDTRYLGFKSDLLLSRSQKDDKGRIAICVRGRKRNECERPDDLRVIDVVINPDLKEDFIKKFFFAGKFENDYAIQFYYFGFNSNKQHLSESKLLNTTNKGSKPRNRKKVSDNYSPIHPVVKHIVHRIPSDILSEETKWVDFNLRSGVLWLNHDDDKGKSAPPGYNKVMPTEADINELFHESTVFIDKTNRLLIIKKRGASICFKCGKIYQLNDPTSPENKIFLRCDIDKIYTQRANYSTCDYVRMIARPE